MKLTLKEIGKIALISILFVSGAVLVVLVTGGVAIPVIGIAGGMIGAGAIGGSIIVGMDFYHTREYGRLEKYNAELLRQKSNLKASLAVLSETSQQHKMGLKQAMLFLSEIEKLNNENTRRILKLANKNDELDRENQFLRRQNQDLLELCTRNDLAIQDNKQQDEKDFVQLIQVDGLCFLEEVPMWDSKDEKGEENPIVSMASEEKESMSYTCSEVNRWRMFLHQLKSDVDDTEWNNKGIDFFGFKAPDTIVTLRNELKKCAIECTALNKSEREFSKLFREVCIDQVSTERFIKKYCEYFEKIGAILKAKVDSYSEKLIDDLSLQQKFYRVWYGNFNEFANKQVGMKITP